MENIEIESIQLEINENKEKKHEFIRRNIEREFSEKEFELVDKLNKEFHEKQINPEDMRRCLPAFEFHFPLTKSKRKSVPYEIQTMKNIRNEFLILLRKSDYKKRFYLCNKSYSDLLEEYEEEFDGILHLVNVKSIQDKDISQKYKIHGIVYSHIVYMLLPKEKIYVLPELFPYKYMESQHEELKHIFTLLGAKSIKWKIMDKKDENSELSSKININSGNINGGLGYESENSTSDLFKNEGVRTFPNNKIVPNIKHILNDKSIFYLMMEDSWKDAITRRIESNIEFDKFSYLYQNKISIQKGFETNLDKMGIQFNYQNSILKKCEIYYEITYYPISGN
jgi:hypothetical protein